jgi:hypothetical protein|tara:strand:+ start:1570 stop:2694 length:1125 start_codon:yes stop_codon:yes gene_type:complete
MVEYYKTDKGYYFKKTKNNKVSRISLKEYLKSNNQKGGNKNQLIVKVYNHLIKNKIIVDKLNNENQLLITNNVANVQSIKTNLFYSHLFDINDKAQPIYIPGEYSLDILKKYFEININIDINGNISDIKLGNGSDNNSEYKYNKTNIDPLNPLYQLLYDELYDISRIWSSVMNIFTSQKNFIILPILINYENGGGHQSVLIFDKFNKKIYPFDPNDTSDESIVFKIANDIKNKIKLDDYDLVSSDNVCGDIIMSQNTPRNTENWRYKCPISGYKCIAGKGYCVQITFYYINFIVNNFEADNDLNSEFIQTLILTDVDTRNMSIQEFGNFIDNKNIDINTNVNDVINVFHLYQYFKIKEWLISKGLNPNMVNVIK